MCELEYTLEACQHVLGSGRGNHTAVSHNGAGHEWRYTFWHATVPTLWIEQFVTTHNKLAHNILVMMMGFLNFTGKLQFNVNATCGRLHFIWQPYLAPLCLSAFSYALFQTTAWQHPFQSARPFLFFERAPADRHLLKQWWHAYVSRVISNDARFCLAMHDRMSGEMCRFVYPLNVAGQWISKQNRVCSVNLAC